MSRFHRTLRFLVKYVLACFIIVSVGLGALWWYLHPKVTEIRGMVYTQRNGEDLVINGMRPEHPNGIAILVMVSGGWKSASDKFDIWMAAPFLREGHTVFAVCHQSQPKASVMDTVEDVRRAARFVRYHAKQYGVDPDRIGVIGASSGGHLGLMLATTGAPGPADATDPVDRADSSVQAASVFFPVTDLVDLGPSTENLHDGGPPKSFRNAFGPKGTDLTAWKGIAESISPIYHITPKMPPIYIVHGDADTLVPLDQSSRFQKKAAESGKTVEVVVRQGKGHGWLTMVTDFRDMAKWLTAHLPEQKDVKKN